MSDKLLKDGKYCGVPILLNHDHTKALPVSVGYKVSKDGLTVEITHLSIDSVQSIYPRVDTTTKPMSFKIGDGVYTYPLNTKGEITGVGTSLFGDVLYEVITDGVPFPQKFYEHELSYVPLERHDWDNLRPLEHKHNNVNWSGPKCECGAKHTVNPLNHSHWCPLAPTENDN